MAENTEHTEQTEMATPAAASVAPQEAATTGGAHAEGDRARRKTRTGIVTSSKMNKTITVMVERKVKHPIYGKFLKKSSSFHAHDEANAAGEGDTVRIMETRPLSKTKRWRLVDIIEKAK